MALLLWPRNKPESLILQVSNLSDQALFEITYPDQVLYLTEPDLGSVLARDEYGGALASLILPTFESARDFAVTWPRHRYFHQRESFPGSLPAPLRAEISPVVYSESIIGSSIQGIMAFLSAVPLSYRPDGSVSEYLLCPRVDGRPLRMNWKTPESVVLKCSLTFSGHERSIHIETGSGPSVRSSRRAAL